MGSAQRDYALNLPACGGNKTKARSKGLGLDLLRHEHIRTLASGWSKNKGVVPYAVPGWEEDGVNTS